MAGAFQQAAEKPDPPVCRRLSAQASSKARRDVTTSRLRFVLSRAKIRSASVNDQFFSGLRGDAQDLTSRLASFIVISGLVPGSYDGMKKPRICAAIGGRDKPGHDALGNAIAKRSSLGIALADCANDRSGTHRADRLGWRGISHARAPARVRGARDRWDGVGWRGGVS